MVDDKGDAVSRPFYLALCGLIALAVAMGVGRFAFTPLLPLMQADAGLTLTGGSWLAFANYLGYLVGALSTVWLPARPSLMVRAGLIATGVLTLAMGLVHGFGPWWVLRFASGVASAFVLVYAASMTLERLTLAGSAQSFGLVFGGVGAGITLTGLACLGLVAAGFDSAAIWIAFGLAALVLSMVCWRAFAAGPGDAQVPAQSGTAQGGWSRAAWTLIVAYGLYGFGYIIPGTFMPVIARDLLGGAFASGWFWPMFGAAGFAGTLLLGSISGEGVHRALVACFFVEALGVIIPVVIPDAIGLAVGSVLLGAAFVVITVLTLRLARAHAAATHTDAAPLMGALTASFGLGQLIGPPLAGYLVVWQGGFGPSLALAATALTAGGTALWIIGR